MKTNSFCCPLLTKNFSKKVISNLLRVSLLLFFFLGISPNSAIAQNSCLISGDAVNGAYPPAVIKVEATPNQANAASGQIAVVNNNDLDDNTIQGGTINNRLKYRAASSVPSSYLWTMTNNTSGAKIFDTTSQVVQVEPGFTVGSFTLTCQVTKLSDSESINTCTVSVAVVNSQ